MITQSDPGRLAILVVDDDYDSADMLAAFLQMCGHDARAAYDGEQALAIVEAWQPDVAILDVVMNGMGGESPDETNRRMKRIPRFAIGH